MTSAVIGSHYAPKLTMLLAASGPKPRTLGPEPTPSERTWGVRPPPRRGMAFSTSEQIRTDDETIPTNTRRENTAPHWTLQQARPLEGELRSTSTRPGQGPLEGEAYNGPAQARPSEGEKPQPPLDPRRQGPLARDKATSTGPCSKQGSLEALNLHSTRARATRRRDLKHNYRYG
jgi:hypothetical protein